MLLLYRKSLFLIKNKEIREIYQYMIFVPSFILNSKILQDLLHNRMLTIFMWSVNLERSKWMYSGNSEILWHSFDGLVRENLLGESRNVMNVTQRSLKWQNNFRWWYTRVCQGSTVGVVRYRGARQKYGRKSTRLVRENV